MFQRRQWHPTPVFLPGESQGRGSLVGCRLWGHTESDMTEATQQQQHTDILGIRHGHFGVAIIQFVTSPSHYMHDLKVEEM